MALACQEDTAMLGSNPSAWQDSIKRCTGERADWAAHSLCLFISFGEQKR